MQRAVILVAVLALGGCAGASGWTIAHHVAIGTAGGSLACDWHGTRSMAESGWIGKDGHAKYESNPAIQAMGGRKPEPPIIDAYFLAVLGLSTLGWYVLPRRYRIAVPLIVTAISVKATINNIVYDVGPCGL